jgi:hypothetical protein
MLWRAKMTTQEASLVSNNPKATYPALSFFIKKITQHVIDLEWESRDYLTHYVLRDTSTDRVYYQGPAIAGFSVSDLKSDTEYQFSIGGYKDHENNATEPAVFAFRTRSSIFPMWATAITRTRIVLHWDVTHSGITLEMNGVPVGDFPAGIRTRSFDGLEPNQTYRFRGKLFDATEWVELDVTTLRDRPTPPTYLGDFEHTIDSVMLHWGPGTVDGGGPVLYRVRRDEEILTADPGTEETYFWDLTPAQGRTYVYSVCTVDDDKNESDRVTRTLSFEDTTAPSEISNLRTTDLTLQVLWDPATDSSLRVKYNVYLNGDPKGTTEETAFSFTKLESGTRYRICVEAEDASGNKSQQICVSYPAIGIPLKHKQ